MISNICPSDSDIAIQFDSVSFSYSDVPVLENASFHIHRGEFAALAGPNGSGKTTVLKLILGLENPAAGQIKLFGSNEKQSCRSKIGYVPQQPQQDFSFPITVSGVVRMGLLHSSRRYGKNAGNAAAMAMEQTDIADLSNRPWNVLSGGQRRRVLVARALAAEPELLVLDEPTANMDAQSEAGLFSILGKLKGNITILIVTHDMDFVSVLSDRVLCMGNSAHKHRGIVQHNITAAEDSSYLQMARVLHGEDIIPDACCRD